jgi:hypothetical protein
MQPKRIALLGMLFLFTLAPASVFTQTQPNSNALYQQLRTLLPGGEVINVSNLELKRDAATFTFQSGSFAFYGYVNGKDTGAVFIGSGHIHITPPTKEERRNLAIFTHTEEFDEDFDRLILRFSDQTAAELRKAATGKSEASNSFIQDAEEFHTFQRQKLHTNFDLRLLEDVLSPAQGSFFLAAIHSHKFPHLLFTIDPHGADVVAPEEVSLTIWSDWGPSIPLAFHLASEYSAHVGIDSKERNATTRITNAQLDTTIEKNGFLTGLATLDVHAEGEDIAVVPLDLYRTLRVSKVDGGDGVSLDFVQEKKEDDADFGVVLAKPLKKGESIKLNIAYGGKDVVTNEGGANYYPIARQSWYPNASQGFGDYAMYRMIFHIPKGLELIATGTKVKESTEGKETTTVWVTEVPVPVVGFNLGKFEMKEGQVPGKLGDNITVDAYANINIPDSMNGISGGNVAGVGNINTPSMLGVQLSQGQAAIEIYTDFFGPLPFTHVALTQQFACNYGQSWPMLVYLPICSFFDSTQQHFLGLSPENMFWKTVTPHEIAHQWWGHTVGFRGYRDQWMSEGFADASASLFLQETRAKPDDFRKFWKDQRQMLIERNKDGFRAIDVGPVTMGYRLNSPKAGWNIARELIYPKGSYILHMVRQMMWTPKDGDARFKATMHDFVNSHRLQPATTEDFKTTIEKYMTPAMDLDGNHKMDWFFNEYVYGTALPNYHFDGSVTHEGDVDTLHLKLTQSNVTPEFRMAVPLYLELNNGNVIRLGSAKVVGNSTIEKTAQLPKLPSPVKRVVMNYFYDVLCTEN